MESNIDDEAEGVAFHRRMDCLPASFRRGRCHQPWTPVPHPARTLPAAVAMTDHLRVLRNLREDGVRNAVLAAFGNLGRPRIRRGRGLVQPR